MYFINESAFAYLLYPKKFNTAENVSISQNRLSELLYYYLNKGVPVTSEMPEPVLVTQSLVDKYGLDPLVINLQRKYKYDYDIVVVKVPQEYLRMDPDFEKDENQFVMLDIISTNILPMNAVGNIDGKLRNLIVPDYVESIYLHYPDCRRIINDNWKPVCNLSLGLTLSDYQKKLIKLFPDDKGTLHMDEMKSKYMQEHNLDSQSMCRQYPNITMFKSNSNVVNGIMDFMRNKYASSNRKMPCEMTKNRIELLLAMETERQEKKDRCSFIGR